MSAKKKTPKPLAWSHAASPACAVAIRELIKVRAKQQLLNVRAKVLQEMIIAHGGGAAHGVRAAIRHQSAFHGMRYVNQNARDFVTFLKADES